MGILVGTGGLVGGTTVTMRVVPGVVVSTTSTIMTPAVPTVVGVGRRSTVSSGGAKSHAARAKRGARITDTPNPNM